MNDQTPSTPITDPFRRYAVIIESMVPSRPAFVPDAETGAAVQVERGVVWPWCMAAGYDAGQSELIDPLARVADAGAAGSVTVVDRVGHHRPVYRGLLMYACLQAYRAVYETMPQGEFGRWEEALRAWCDALEAELTTGRLPDDGIPAAAGTGAAGAAWTALALHVAGKVFVRDAWTDLSSDTFGRITRSQQPSGSFLLTTASDNPEPTWYHELAILHAAASYAVQSEDRPLAAAVRRATEFHQAETQPDHATSQPWAVFAFLWNERTRPFADGLLHAATVQQRQQTSEPPGDGTGVQGVPLMLLADALYCLRLFL